MPYVPYVPKSKSTPGNFGNMKRDGAHNSVNAGNFIQTQDATGTPVTSPVTVNTTQTLIVPQGAISCTISPVTNAVQVSEDSSMTAYFAVPAAAIYTFDCANMANIYLKTGGSTVVSFAFKMV